MANPVGGPSLPSSLSPGVAHLSPLQSLARIISTIFCRLTSCFGRGGEGKGPTDIHAANLRCPQEQSILERTTWKILNNIPSNRYTSALAERLYEAWSED